MKSLFNSFDQSSSRRFELPEIPSSVTTIACDTETSGIHFLKDKPVGISIAYYQDNGIKSFYLPFGHTSGNLDFSKVKFWMETELAFKTCIFAHAKFDIHMLKNCGIDLEAVGTQPIDVQFAGALLDDSRWSSLSLNSLSKKYIGKTKLEFKGKGNMANYPAHLVENYARRDAEISLELYKVTLDLLQREGLENVYDLENSLIYAVCTMERNGCLIDASKLESMLSKSTRQYAQLIYKLHKELGWGINPASNPDMRKLFNRLHLPIPIGIKRVRKKVGENPDGTPIVEWVEEECETFAELYLKKVDHPLVQLALQAKQVGSVKSKFLVPYSESLSSDNKLFYGLNQLKTGKQGTISGRFSSVGSKDNEAGYGFNVQQVSGRELFLEDEDDLDFENEGLPEYPIRELFIADPKTVWFACDARQIEYRLFVHFSKAKKALAAYKSQPLTQYHEIVQNMLVEAGSNIQYKQTKIVNFCRLFGGGAAKIGRMIDLDLPSTQRFLRLYDKILPEGKTFMRNLTEEAETKGFVRGLSGRKSRFGDGSRPSYAATNALVQSSAADLFKLKLSRLYKEKDNLGVVTLLQPVHDEQNACIDPNPKYKKMLEDFFDSQEIDLRVPVLWEAGTGSNWAEAKGK